MYCTCTSWKTSVDEELLEDLKAEKEDAGGAGKGGSGARSRSFSAHLRHLSTENFTI